MCFPPLSKPTSKRACKLDPSLRPPHLLTSHIGIATFPPTMQSSKLSAATSVSLLSLKVPMRPTFATALLTPMVVVVVAVSSPLALPLPPKSSTSAISRSVTSSLTTLPLPLPRSSSSVMISATSVARLMAATTTGAGASAAGVMGRGAGLPRVMEMAPGARAEVLTSKCILRTASEALLTLLEQLPSCDGRYLLPGL
jgi:hypothetical protein